MISRLKRFCISKVRSRKSKFLERHICSYKSANEKCRDDSNYLTSQNITFVYKWRGYESSSKIKCSKIKKYFFTNNYMPHNPFPDFRDGNTSYVQVIILIRSLPSGNIKLLCKLLINVHGNKNRKNRKPYGSNKCNSWKEGDNSAQSKHDEIRQEKSKPDLIVPIYPNRRLHNGVGLTTRSIVAHRKLSHVNLPLAFILPQNKISIHFLNIHQLYLYIIHMMIYCVIVHIVNAFWINCLMSLKFIQELAKNGLRVFTIDKARVIASNIGLKQSYVPRLLSKLSRENVIVHLIKGTYAVSNTLLPGSPLHPYEVAMGLIQPAAICCWSAMIYHRLSDQILRKTFILTPHLEGSKNSSFYTYTIETHEYVLIRVKPKNFWGIKTIYIDSTKVYVTDLERTLLDGLVRPKYCGGILEAISAFERAAQEIDPIKLYDYVLKCSHTIQQRLGWILDHLKILPDLRLKLEEHVRNYKTCAKLNPEGQLRGKRNLVWKIVENI